MPLVPAEAFPFCGPTFLATSPLIDAQRAINLYPDPGISSSKTRMGLVGRPGLLAWSNIAGPTVGHALFAGAGRMFAALGGHVYELNNNGTVATDYGTGLNVGTPSPAVFSANGVQLLICDPVLHKIFNVNPAGPSLDLVFNANALEYLDGFYLAIATGASLAGSNPNQINASTNGDGTTWPGLSYAIRTGAADLTIQLAVLNSLLYIFGQKTTEVWYDAGTSPFPLARVNGGTINIGCLAAASVVKFFNTIIWLGADGTGYGQVYMMNGMNPVRVSNSAIESMIAAFSSQVNLPNAKAYGYQEAGHTFYVLNLCNSSYQTTQTLVYDLTTGLWHERVFNSILPQHFASVPNFSVNIPNYVCDEKSGKIFYQSIAYASDATAAITYSRTAPHASNENRWLKYPRFELDIDPQGAPGSIAPILDYSNNGGRSFLGYNYAMAQAMDQGNAGGLQRFYATQLGRSKDRVFKVSITDNTNLIRIASAYLTVEPGE